MDADVAIQDFITEPFVIERPIGASDLAQDATSWLTRRGLALDFSSVGQARAIAADIAVEALPSGVGILDRTTGMVSAGDGSATVVAGPLSVKAPQGTEAACMATFQTFAMIGHVMTGAAKAPALAWASLASLKAGLTRSDLHAAATLLEAEEWQGPRRGNASDVVRSVATRGALLAASPALQTEAMVPLAHDFAKAADDPSRARVIEYTRTSVAVLEAAATLSGRTLDEWSTKNQGHQAIERFLGLSGAATGTLPGMTSAYAPQPQDFRESLKNAAIAGDGDALDAIQALRFDVADMRATGVALGVATPTFREMAGIPDTPPARFEAQPFGATEEGPSWLPETAFRQETLRSVQGVHPDLLKVVARASQIATVPFEVVPKTGAIRDNKMQQRLKAAGRSLAKVSRHTVGYALDLVPLDGRGRIDFGDMKGFEAIRDAMQIAAEELDVPIVWGGNWTKLVDQPHYELDRRIYPLPGKEAEPEAVVAAFR